MATNASTVTASGTGHGLGAVGSSHGHGNQHMPSTQPHGTSASRHHDGATGYHAGTAASGHHAGGSGYHNVGGNVSEGFLPGPAPNTAGPHKSDLMNKLDPRVDSQGGQGGHSGY